MKPFALLLLFCLFLASISCSKTDDVIGNPASDSLVGKKQIYLADPTIFYHDGIYYLYGTNMTNRGFLVYISEDLKTWEIPVAAKDGFALRKEDVYGTEGFWAPQVFKYHGKFYMAYTANKQIAIAESDSPLGPFKQEVKQPLFPDVKTIDPFVFVDSDGSVYLYLVYHVPGIDDNQIYVVQLTDDLKEVQPGTLTLCISAKDNPQPWEHVGGHTRTITEGPTVLKHNSMYYLFYSANGYTSVDYAVGYATADKPLGPWKKYEGNPILSRMLIRENGVGHGDFFQDPKGEYYYVFHTHYSDNRIGPRRTGIIKGCFVPDKNRLDKMKFDKDSFYYLKWK